MQELIITSLLIIFVGLMNLLCQLHFSFFTLAIILISALIKPIFCNNCDYAAAWSFILEPVSTAVFHEQRSIYIATERTVYDSNADPN